MNSTKRLYGIRKNGVSHGDVFTSSEIVNFMLDLIGYKADIDLSKYKILEPSFGEGEFLIEIQHRITLSSQKFQFDASEIMSHNVYGCEIDESKYKKCIGRLKQEMPDFKPLKLKREDFLLSKWDTTFNYIIGNPPYIRYERIPNDLKEKYKRKFRTYYYRPDLYILFFEQSLELLNESGKHCFICANRWLKNIYGKNLRKFISLSYNLETLIDIEHLDAFTESVLAYPAITVISCGVSKGVKKTSIKDIIELTRPINYDQVFIKNEEDWSNLFSPTFYDSLSSIEAQGFKIGIGVATGADKIFISEKLSEDVDNEILLPIVNAKDLTGNKFKWNGKYLLNPYNTDGSLIDLTLFPKTKSYLEKYKTELSNRHIVKHGKAWYSLIDKVKPELLKEPKILLPDISGNKLIFIDKGCYYPAHNIYYITGDLDKLYLLAAILMSDFVKNQISNISNKMNGGLPRWQSQSIKKLRIPYLNMISPENKIKLKEAYNDFDISEINRCMDLIISNNCVKNRPQKYIPLSIFDFGHTV